MGKTGDGGLSYERQGTVGCPIGVLINAEAYYGRVIETSFFIAFSCGNYYNDLGNIGFDWNNQKITGFRKSKKMYNCSFYCMPLSDVAMVGCRLFYRI